MKRYIVLDKKVGETPLECMENWRAAQPPAYQGVPMTYAGRLDPMASGKLLILIGEECKKKNDYLHLDKEYKFEILFNVSSDTGDILGFITTLPRAALGKVETKLPRAALGKICKELEGDIELPYPHFSSKTVGGKPLHTWTLEGRLDEITIPTRHSTIYSLKLDDLYTQTRSEIYTETSRKIETIPPVTEARKSLGNDFRRSDVRADWQRFNEAGSADDLFHIAKITCIASSGTYMRSLAEVIAARLDTTGLAYSIHRTKIGQYKKLPFGLGFWQKKI